MRIQIPLRLVPENGESVLELSDFVAFLEEGGVGLDIMLGVRAPDDIHVLVTLGGYAAKPCVFGVIYMVATDDRTPEVRNQFVTFVSEQIKDWFEHKTGSRPETDIVIQLVERSSDYKN